MLADTQQEISSVLQTLGCVTAGEVAAQIVARLQARHGGQEVYIPSARGDRKAEIARALAAGADPKTVAATIGCHVSTIRRYRRQWSI